MAYITHGVLSGGAVSRIQNSRLKSLVITDSIQPTEAVKAAKNIRVLSIAPLIGEAIMRTAARKASRACSIKTSILAGARRRHYAAAHAAQRPRSSSVMLRTSKSFFLAQV